MLLAALGAVIITILVAALIASYTVFGVSLDVKGRPTSGRSADRLARWKSREHLRHQHRA